MLFEIWSLHQHGILHVFVGIVESDHLGMQTKEIQNWRNCNFHYDCHNPVVDDAAAVNHVVAADAVDDNLDC